ncbi:MAG: hypothetical protein KatS3mg115_1347 [Candidatus Poribacteria bacterium]|nr:MAG: hypothetical protein KatS3mg115_1347 [Candidatus Poribacteria bacterium]
MRRLRWIGAGVALSLAAGASQAAVMGDIAIFIDFVGWIGQGTAQLAAQQILDNQTVAENAEIVGGNEIADWVEARIDDGKMDMIITFGGFPDDLYAAGNAEPDGSLAEEFLYGGNFFLNTADYIFYYSNGIQNGDVALKNITNSNFDMWTDGNASQPTPDGEKYLPSMGNFSAPARLQARPDRGQSGVGD